MNTNILKVSQRKSKKIVCQICGKTNHIGCNRPHSLHRTKRFVKPNIQKIAGQYICTRCLRTKVK